MKARPDVSAPCAVIVPFPLAGRTVKVRGTAAKLLATTTDRHARHYRHQVTQALGAHLRSRQVPHGLHAAQIRQFWAAVEIEVARLQFDGRRHGPGGAA